MYDFFKKLKAIFSFSRHSVTFKSVVGESNSVTPEMIASWLETTLPTLLSNYKLEDIYNADEFGLFYQCLPNKTYHLKSEKCSGGKHSKVRLTGLAAANAVGEKLPMFVIGKSKTPRCFKNVTSLPCRYRSQQKSWMDSTLFEEWVREINRKFQRENRKIAMIIDNCPAHPDVQDISNVTLIFLPPNTTSASQPMDQGVIKCLKALYRRRLVKLMIRCLDQGKDLPKISIIRGMELLSSSWEDVSKETVVNCFRKAKISAEDQIDAIEDNDDPFKDLNDDLAELKEKDPSLLPDDFSAEEFVDVDLQVIATDNPVTDEEIIQSVVGIEVSEDENDDQMEVYDAPINKPSKNEVDTAIETLRSLSLYSKNGNDMRSFLQRLESFVETDRTECKRQASIADYFLK